MRGSHFQYSSNGMKSDDVMYDGKKKDNVNIDDEDIDDEDIDDERENHVICCMKAISTANRSIFRLSASDSIQRPGAVSLAT